MNEMNAHAGVHDAEVHGQAQEPTEAPKSLHDLLNDPVRSVEIAHALALSDEVSPNPASAHTALLILRNALAMVCGKSAEELDHAFSARLYPRQSRISNINNEAIHHAS